MTVTAEPLTITDTTPSIDNGWVWTSLTRTGNIMTLAWITWWTPTAWTYTWAYGILVISDWTFTHTPNDQAVWTDIFTILVIWTNGTTQNITFTVSDIDNANIVTVTTESTLPYLQGSPFDLVLNLSKETSGSVAWTSCSWSKWWSCTVVSASWTTQTIRVIPATSVWPPTNRVERYTLVWTPLRNGRVSTSYYIDSAPTYAIPTFSAIPTQNIDDNGWGLPTDIDLSSYLSNDNRSWATYSIVNDPTWWALFFPDPSVLTLRYDGDISPSQSYTITIKVTNPDTSEATTTFTLNVNNNL